MERPRPCLLGRPGIVLLLCVFVSAKGSVLGLVMIIENEVTYYGMRALLVATPFFLTTFLFLPYFTHSLQAAGPGALRPWRGGGRHTRSRNATANATIARNLNDNKLLLVCARSSLASSFACALESPPWPRPLPHSQP